MITLAQIDAESMAPVLTESQVMALTMLVKRYPPYREASGLYPALADKLQAEIDTATVKTQALKAVLTQLGIVPTFVVESQGSADSQSFFSTRENWAELAQDVLDILYEVPISTGPRSYAIAQRRVTQLALRERTVLLPSETGRRY